MDKPYTPSMVTGIMLGVTSVIVLVIFSKEQLLNGSGYAWGVPLTIVCFAVMQRTVLAIYGLNYRFMIANVKKKFRGTVEIPVYLSGFPLPPDGSKNPSVLLPFDYH